MKQDTDRTGIICGLLSLACAGVMMVLCATVTMQTEDKLWQARADTQRAVAAASSLTAEGLDKDATIAQLQALDALPDGMTATYAGEYTLTSYCTEQYEHICGTGDGITASGAPVTPGLTVAADLTMLPLGTVVYISGVGVRIVQDTGGGLQGNHLDIAVAGTHEDALGWPLGGAVAEVWILGGVDNADA